MKLAAVLGNVWPSAGCVFGWAEGVSALNVGVVGASQISGTAPKFWHNSSNCVKNCAGSLTSSNLRANFEASNQAANSLVEAFWKLASLKTLVKSSLIWVGSSPLCKSFIPSLVSSQAALCNLASVSQSFFVDWERNFWVETAKFLQALNSFFAKLGAVGSFVVGLAWGWPSNQSINLNEVRLVGNFLSLFNSCSQSLNVFLVGAVWLNEANFVGVPTVCTVTSKNIFREGELSVAFNLNVVCIEDYGQIAELLVSSQGSSFRRNAFLNVAFAADNPNLVIEWGSAGWSFWVKKTALKTLAVSETNSRGKTLAEWAGGHFDAWG